MVWPLFQGDSRRLALLWSGRDPVRFFAIARALREVGISFDRTRARGIETLPPSLHPSTLFFLPVFKIRVRPEDKLRALAIVHSVLEGAPPA